MGFGSGTCYTEEGGGEDRKKELWWYAPPQSINNSHRSATDLAALGLHLVAIEKLQQDGVCRRSRGCCSSGSSGPPAAPPDPEGPQPLLQPGRQRRLARARDRDEAAHRRGVWWWQRRARSQPGGQLGCDLIRRGGVQLLRCRQVLETGCAPRNGLQACIDGSGTSRDY